MKNYYTELPEGFKKFAEANSAGGEKLAKWLNIFSIFIMIIMVYITYSLRFAETEDVSIVGFWLSRIHLLFFLFVFVAALICHSFLHGLVYKLITGQDFKISAGGNIICCSLPGVYVNRKTAILALLAPFVVFSAAFIIAMNVTEGYLALAFVFAFAIHAGCCTGDFYNVILLAFVFKGDVLMCDGGTKQTYYMYHKLPDVTADEQN